MSHKSADPRNKAGNSAMKFVSLLPGSRFQPSPVSCFFVFGTVIFNIASTGMSLAEQTVQNSSVGCPAQWVYEGT